MAKYEESKSWVEYEQRIRPKCSIHYSREQKIILLSTPLFLSCRTFIIYTYIWLDTAFKPKVGGVEMI